MLHAAVLRSPYAHARVKSIDLAPALALPGVRGAVGPGEAPGLEHEAGYSGAPVAAVAADTLRPGARRAGRDRDRVGAAGGRARPGGGGRARGSCTVRRSGTSEATSTAPSRRPTSSSKGRTARRSSCTTRWRRTSPCASGSATGSTSTRRRNTSGACATRWRRELGLAPDKVRVVCEYMGGGFGSKNSAGEYTFVAAELARRTGRPVRCALTRREENTAAGNRNATIQKLTAAATQRRDDHGARRRLRERARLGRLVGGDGGADEDAVRVRQRAHRRATRRRSTRRR